MIFVCWKYILFFIDYLLFSIFKEVTIEFSLHLIVIILFAMQSKHNVKCSFCDRMVNTVLSAVICPDCEAVKRLLILSYA